MSDDDRNSSTYFVSLERFTPTEQEEVCHYLKLLRQFVKSTAYLEGTEEHEGQEGSADGIWKVSPWMQVMSDKIDGNSPS